MSDLPKYHVHCFQKCKFRALKLNYWQSESFDGGAIICDAADVIFLGGMKLNDAVPCFLK